MNRCTSMTTSGSRSFKCAINECGCESMLRPTFRFGGSRSTCAIWERLSSPGRLATRDQADAAAKTQVRPEPIDERRHAISDIQHEAHVRDAPEPPSRRSRQFDEAKICDGGLAADGSEAAEMFVTKRRRRSPGFDLR